MSFIQKKTIIIYINGFTIFWGAKTGVHNRARQFQSFFLFFIFAIFFPVFLKIMGYMIGFGKNFVHASFKVFCMLKF